MRSILVPVGLDRFSFLMLSALWVRLPGSVRPVLISSLLLVAMGNFQDFDVIYDRNRAAPTQDEIKPDPRG